MKSSMTIVDVVTEMQKLCMTQAARVQSENALRYFTSTNSDYTKLPASVVERVKHQVTDRSFKERVMVPRGVFLPGWLKKEVQNFNKMVAHRRRELYAPLRKQWGKNNNKGKKNRGKRGNRGRGNQTGGQGNNQGGNQGKGSAPASTHNETVEQMAKRDQKKNKDN